MPHSPTEQPSEPKPTRDVNRDILVVTRNILVVQLAISIVDLLERIFG